MKLITTEVTNAKLKTEEMISKRDGYFKRNHSLERVLGSKSAIGEFAEFMLDEMVQDCKPRTSSNHDRILPLYGKTECKGAKQINNKVAMFNQIYPDKDWASLVLTLVHEDKIEAWIAKDKEKLLQWEHLGHNNGRCFNKQFKLVRESDLFELLYEGTY